MRQIRDKAYRSRGMRNNNPFNVVLTSELWRGKIPNKDNTDGKFEQFRSLRDGIRCGMIVILNYIKKHNINAVHDIIYRFCPDLTAPSYVSNVCRMSFLRPNMVIDTENKFLVLCRCMLKVESSYDCPPSSLMDIYLTDIPSYLKFGVVVSSQDLPKISQETLADNLTK